jgi:flagellar biosynthetic protein FliQ
MIPYDPDALELVRQTLLETILIAAPILGAGICVGLFVSIIQSITSIQDQTLTFVPKIFVMITVAALLLPWIVSRLLEYAANLFLLL